MQTESDDKTPRGRAQRLRGTVVVRELPRIRGESAIIVRVLHYSREFNFAVNFAASLSLILLPALRSLIRSASFIWPSAKCGPEQSP